uniref:Uncharacterized protein n=1 Tax=Cucumis sativus TaxID=3659 RepID=A0A0A0L0T0_CUCSA
MSAITLDDKLHNISGPFDTKCLPFFAAFPIPYATSHCIAVSLCFSLSHAFLFPPPLTFNPPTCKLVTLNLLSSSYLLVFSSISTSVAWIRPTTGPPTDSYLLNGSLSCTTTPTVTPSSSFLLPYPLKFNFFIQSSNGIAVSNGWN